MSAPAIISLILFTATKKEKKGNNQDKGKLVYCTCTCINLFFSKVPIKRNLTGNTCTHALLFPFFTYSVLVLYPFSICSLSVLFCSCPVCVPLVSILGTCSQVEQGSGELVYKNASKELVILS